MRLHRGCGRSFSGKNWALVADDKWSYQRVYIPHGKEPLIGTRKIGNVEYVVFKCLNDDFFAQPKKICVLPLNEDPLFVMPELEISDEKWKELSKWNGDNIELPEPYIPPDHGVVKKPEDDFDFDFYINNLKK